MIQQKPRHCTTDQHMMVFTLERNSDGTTTRIPIQIRIQILKTRNKEYWPKYDFQITVKHAMLQCRKPENVVLTDR